MKSTLNIVTATLTIYTRHPPYSGVCYSGDEANSLGIMSHNASIKLAVHLKHIIVQGAINSWIYKKEHV